MGEHATKLIKIFFDLDDSEISRHMTKQRSI